MVIVVFVVLIVLIGRLFTIQITQHQKYSKIAKRQQNKSLKIKAERGVITDRNGELLAYTKNDVSLFVDTRMTTKREKIKIAKRFASLFGKSEKHYLKLLNSAKKNICLEKKASKEKILKLSDFIVSGYFQVEDYSRVYPYGSLASHILGFANRKLVGVAGVEKQLNKFLVGRDGSQFIENDVRGRVVTVSKKYSVEPVAGNSIELTINKNYQKILEEEVSKGLKKYKGETAVGIIMNPKTGEILALTNQPDYDPANYNLYSDRERRNRALTDTYEPGSTMKPLVMSMLIEEDLTYESEKVNTENGRYRTKGITISDTHEYRYLTASEIITHSSNVGIAKLSDRMDANTFYRYLRNYGFGNLTSVDLPGEAAGLLKKPKSYSKVSKKFISFGYEIGVTPIQLLTAYCALVNGGDLLQPYIVKSIKDARGNVVEEFSKTKIRTVISEKTSKRIIEMMKDVVENGTGKEAQLPTIQVAGKTGTTQRLVNHKYSNKDYNSSFVGFFPADNPKYISLIVVKSPKIGRYGGRVAAPIFREVAARIVESDKSIIINKSFRRISDDSKKYAIEDTRAEDIFTTSNLPTETEKGKREVSFVGDSSVMPNLINYTKRDAIKILNDLGIKYKVIGSGTVISQSVKAGKKIKGISICELKCKSLKKKSRLRIN